MTAQRNSMWQAHVRRLLIEGYGAEDIAVLTKYPVRDVRQEIEILRESGELAGIYRLPRSKGED